MAVRAGLRRLPLALGLAALCGGAAVEAQSSRYVAFGDSITRGLGDDPDKGGYPARLQVLLNGAGRDAVVENRGVDGETTVEGLSRLSTLSGGGTATLLLMEGTNDIAQGISAETVATNLESLVRRGRQRGFATVAIATIVPRRPSGTNAARLRETEYLAWQVRRIAHELEAPLVDPYEVLSQTDDLFARFYADEFHPNAAGYDLLAGVFADLLLGRDRVPPVPAFVLPVDDSIDVSSTPQLQVVLYDLGTGIDTEATVLLLGDSALTASVTGDAKSVTLRYRPIAPLTGRQSLTIRSRDLASPPNTIDRVVSEFLIAGTTFLPGDIDRSGRVDGLDLVRLAVAFGSRAGESRYSAAVDLDSDGRIDGSDLAILAANFGKSSF